MSHLGSPSGFPTLLPTSPQASFSYNDDDSDSGFEEFSNYGTRNSVSVYDDRRIMSPKRQDQERISEQQQQEEEDHDPSSTYGFSKNEKSGDFARASALLKAMKSQKASIYYDLIADMNLEQVLSLQKSFKKQKMLGMCEFISTLEEILDMNPREKAYVVSGLLLIFLLKLFQFHGYVIYASIISVCRVGGSVQIVLRQLLALYEQINFKQLPGLAWEDFYDFFMTKTSRAKSDTSDLPFDITRYQSQPKSYHHGDVPIEKMIYVPELQKILTCDKTKNACVRDVSTGKMLKELSGHTSTVINAGFIKKLDCFITCGADSTIGCYDINCTRTKVIETEDPQISYLWMEATDVLATGDTKGVLRFWDVKEGYATRPRVKCHDDWIMDIIQIPEYNLIVTGSLDKTIKIWDSKSYSSIISHRAHNLGVTSLTYSTFATLLFSCGSERDIFAWNPGKRGVVHKMSGHDKATVGVFSKEGSPELISADVTGCIKIWDIRRFSCVQTLSIDLRSREYMDSMRISSMCFDVANNQIISAGNRLQLWKPIQDRSNDITSNQPIITAGFLDYQAYKNFLIASGDEISVWDANSGTLEHSFRCSHEISKLLILERKAIIGLVNGGIEIANISTGAILSKLQPFHDEVCHLLCTNRKYFLAGSGNGSGLVFHCPTFNDVIFKFSLSIPFTSTPHMASSAEHHVIAVAGGKTIVLYRAETGLTISSIELDGPVQGMSFCDAMQALVSMDSFVLRFWSIGSFVPIIRVSLAEAILSLTVPRTGTNVHPLALQRDRDLRRRSTVSLSLQQAPSFLECGWGTGSKLKSFVNRSPQDFSSINSLMLTNKTMYLVLDMSENDVMIWDLRKVVVGYHLYTRKVLPVFKAPSDFQVKEFMSDLESNSSATSSFELPKYPTHPHRELTMSNAEDIFVHEIALNKSTEVRAALMYCVDDPFVLVSGCTEGRVRLWGLRGESLGRFARNGDNHWLYNPSTKHGSRIPASQLLKLSSSKSDEEDDLTISDYNTSYARLVNIYQN
eukprot:TRINITY_DN8862_c0_g1_i7.p1 TRINITY_DN8862_c0_g1~~TRINITY_DN8862_c0_g1_i7.p1  ORF type:complete len:1022 (-),score=113.12 TRINITY_DN8862_c0_g1_i7:2007-5072(-)